MTYPDAQLSDEIEDLSFTDDPARFDLTRPGDLLLAAGRILAAIHLKKPIEIAQVDRDRAWPTSPAYVPREVRISWNALNHRWLLMVIRDSDGMPITYGPVVQITHA
ncbi:hypothetical protein [Nonomuraea dietziae]|uniref:Uncharacterized protein n=1 Tax=Nonomuraea dietziae TaxID=65515 RepID=A0A7W5VFQ7_9ACTN|nr:hypothetical protein [Nonomuraea dietziae]MBB3734081.1 hypothetical protein [Nonomuraea dietziae]